MHGVSVAGLGGMGAPPIRTSIRCPTPATWASGVMHPRARPQTNLAPKGTCPEEGSLQLPDGLPPVRAFVSLHELK